MNQPSWFEGYSYFLFWSLGAITGWLVKEGVEYLQKAKKLRGKSGR